MAKILKMNPEVKKKWLKALRSGEYKQTVGVLHKKGGGFCCLGVLTDLYLKEKGIEDGWVGEDRGDECQVKLTKSGEHDFENLLPSKVASWAGLKGQDNPVCGDFSLAEWNDGEGGATRKTFKKIADLIEKHL